jgi:hypothetical protein
MARHPKSTEMVKSLHLGVIIDGSTILSYGPVHEDNDGSYAWRIVLRTLPSNELHPFVVHNMIYDDDLNLWRFGQGDYAETLEEGLDFFYKRIGVGSRKF